MTISPQELQRLLDELPASSHEVLNQSRSLYRQGQHPWAQHLLTHAYAHTFDVRFLALYASLLMTSAQHRQAFEFLSAYLNPDAPDVHIVLLMTEALIGQRSFDLAEQYLTYARQIGASTPRLDNLALLLKQRVREQHGGQQAPLDIALDSHIDMTRPQIISNIPLADSAYSIEGEVDDHTDFVRGQFSEQQLPSSAQHTTALESIPTHVAALSVDALPTMASEAPSEVIRRYQSEVEEQFEEQDTSALPASSITMKASKNEAFVDATTPFRRSQHLPAPIDATLEDNLLKSQLGDLDLSNPYKSEPPSQEDELDDARTGFVSLKPGSTSSHVQDPNVFIPTATADDDLASQSQVRAAYFGTPGEPASSPARPFTDPLPNWPQEPTISDPAPSFGAKPAPAQDVYYPPPVPEPSPDHASSHTSLARSSSHASLSRESHAQARNRAHPPRSEPLELEQAPFVPQIKTTPPSPGKPIEPAAPREGPRLPLKQLFSGVAAVFVLAAGTSLLADYLLSRSLDEAFIESSSRHEYGSHTASLEALAILDDTRDTTTFAGEWLEDLNASFATVLPFLYRAPERRARIAAEAAHQASLIEWFFEAPGTRGASERLRAQQEEQGELLELARIYSELSVNPASARQRAERLYRQSPRDLDVALAMANAAYHTGYLTLGKEISDALEDFPKQSSAHKFHTLHVLNLYRSPRLAEQFDAIFEQESLFDLSTVHLLQARHYKVDLKRLEESERHLAELMQNLPADTTEPCYLSSIELSLAHIMLARQELDKTRELLESAAARCPAHLEVGRMLVTHDMKTGHHEAARERIARLASSYPDADFELLMARLATHTGEHRLFHESLAPHIEPPMHPEALEMLARDEILTSRPKLAMGHLEQAAQIDTRIDLVLALEHLAKTYSDPDAAHAKKVQELITQHPSYAPELKAILSQILRERGLHATSTEERDKLFQSAQRALIDVIGDSLYDAEPRYMLCELYLDQNKPTQAREACEDAKKTDAVSMYGQLAMARLHIELGEIVQAKKILLPLDATHPDYFPLARTLIALYIAEGALGAASKRINTLKQVYTDHPMLPLIEGRLAFAQGRYADALSFFQQAHNQSSSSVETAIFLAYSRVRMGETEQPEIEDVLRSHLAHPLLGGYAWLALGELRRRQGRHKDAEENLEQAIKLLDSPGISSWFKIEAHTQRALSWQAQHGWQHARVQRYLEQAEALDEDTHADLKYLLGALAISRKDEAGAVEEFSEALTIQSSHCPTLKALKNLKKDTLATFDIDALWESHCAP